jgi:glycosyltransferase involved in cell wall biosynthesis
MLPIRSESTIDLKVCNLLVISDRYPHAKDPISSSFVKNQVRYLKDYVKKVYVIVLAPFVPKFLSHFQFMNGKGRYDGYAVDYKYDNVEVYFAKPWSMPLEFSRKRRGDEGLRGARRVIEKNGLDFDLIHAHFTFPSGYVGAKLKESSGNRLILTVHEDRNWFREEVASCNQRFIYAWKNADRIIRVNRSDLCEFERINIDRSKLIYLPNGFSAEQFKPMNKRDARAKLNLPQDKKIVLNLAALEGYKGQEYLIRAMKTAAAFRKDLALYIVGKGSLQNHLQSLIDQEGLQDNVILAGGNKSAEEIALWMNSCDIFALPSLSESFGIVQLEAMACGKPVVATNNGGSEEIIIDRNLGILVEPRDVSGLSNAILKALDCNWDSNYIMNYTDQFTWKVVAEKTAKLYQDILRESDKHGSMR